MNLLEHTHTHTQTHTHTHRHTQTHPSPLFFSPVCNDECVVVLFDDLDELRDHFLSVNTSGVVMAPYSQLVALQNQTREIQVSR